MHRTLQNRDIILKHLQAIEYDDNHSYASGFYCGDDEVVIDDIFGKVSPEELLSEYQIDQSNFSDNVKAYFINSDLRLLVLEECDLLVLTDDTQSEIYAVTDGLHFVVDDLHRGKGYGKFLVKATLLMDGNLKNWDSDKHPCKT